MMGAVSQGPEGLNEKNPPSVTVLGSLPLSLAQAGSSHWHLTIASASGLPAR